MHSRQVCQNLCMTFQALFFVLQKSIVSKLGFASLSREDNYLLLVVFLFFGSFFSSVRNDLEIIVLFVLYV